MFKLARLNINENKREEMKLKNIEVILKEWKLVTRRVERCFLVINVLMNTITALVLFGKYYFNDYIKNQNLDNNNECGCEYSFI